MATNKRQTSGVSWAVARHLRNAREQRKRSQTEVEQATGISRATIQRIEAGARVIDIREFVTLCNYLKVAPGLLLTEAITDADNSVPRPYSDGLQRGI